MKIIEAIVVDNLEYIYIYIYIYSYETVRSEDLLSFHVFLEILQS